MNKNKDILSYNKLRPFTRVKILFLIIIFFFTLNNNVFAQVRIGLNTGPAFPVGNFKDAISIGAGFDIFSQYFFSENRIALGIRAGYTIFSSRSISFNNQPVRYSLAPIVVTLKYYLSERILQPYIAIDAGVGILRMRNMIGRPNRINSGFTKFLVTPIFGVDYNISDAVSLSVNGRYNMMISTDATETSRVLSFVNVNLGIFYKF